MSSYGRPWSEHYLLPFSLGLADGIVNALTLASATVLHGRGLTAWLGLRVGAVALVTAAFTIFVAEYAQLRSELTRAERETEPDRRRATGGRQPRSASVARGRPRRDRGLCGQFRRRGRSAADRCGHETVQLVGAGRLGGGSGRAGRWTGQSRERPSLRWIVVMTAMGVLVAYIGVVLDIA